MASFSLLLRRCLRGKGRCFGHNRDPCNHALLLCPVCAPATNGFKVPENLHWVPISRPGPAAPGSPAATRRRQNQCFIVREMSSVESPRWGFRSQPCHLLARILYLFFSYIKWQFIFILLYIRDATRLLFLECFFSLIHENFSIIALWEDLVSMRSVGLSSKKQCLAWRHILPSCSGVVLSHSF